jgi:hypothetical protein
VIWFIAADDDMVERDREELERLELGDDRWRLSHHRKGSSDIWLYLLGGETQIYIVIYCEAL